MTRQRLYAIRIGDPRRHTPYFMLREGTALPALFTRRYLAESQLPKKSSARVVRAWLHDGRCEEVHER